MDEAFVFTSFSVDDMDAAKAFYVDKLGFELGAPMDEYALKIKKGGQRFHIYPKPDHQPATFTVINFKVEDIASEVKRLKDAGVKFEHYDNENTKTDENSIATWEQTKMAWFKDPAGNIHGLLQGEG